MDLEEIIRHDPRIATIKEKPYVSIFILVASAVCAHLSTTIPQNENLGFSMMLFSTAIAIWGLKGIIWPRKHFILKETGEQLIRKEFFFDYANVEQVKKCLNVQHPLSCLERLHAMPQTGALTLRVIIYTTHSGSYMQHQIQKYIPYEYVPL